MSRARRGPPVLAFSGASGAGKTTLLERLIPALIRRGLTVAALKHSGHAHPLDQPGKDSFRLRRAGAVAVAVQAADELAWFGPPPAGGVRALARLLPRVDLVLAEGFKGQDVPRVEVRRSAVTARSLAARDRRVIAVVGDVAPPAGLPWFAPEEVEALAAFVARFTRSGDRARGRALAAAAPRAHPEPERGTSASGEHDGEDQQSKHGAPHRRRAQGGRTQPPRRRRSRATRGRRDRT